MCGAMMDVGNFGSKSLEKMVRDVNETKIKKVQKVGDQRIGSYSRVGYQERVGYCFCS
jgi:hypothetical protein